MQAALSGEVDWLFDTIGTTLGHQQAGKLRYLAVCAEKRTSAVPDLPTTAECGLPDVLVSTVNPVALPAGVPADVVNTLAEATRRIMADEKLAGRPAGARDRAGGRRRPGEIRCLFQRRAEALGADHQGERRPRWSEQSSRRTPTIWNRDNRAPARSA